MKRILLILILFITAQVNAAEVCSRTATVNYQEVLVDAGSGKLGEGLRYYLDKDIESSQLLAKYQKSNKPTLLNASASTFGSLMLLTGVLQTGNEDGIRNKSVLMYGGVTLIALSYLSTKTKQYDNEKILEEAIEQYNKRNKPRIYFSPYKDNNNSAGLSVGIKQGF